MRETTKQNLAIIFITLFFGGSIYLFVNNINPLIERYKQLKKEIEEEKLKISEIKKYKQKSEELIRIYTNLSNEVLKIDSALPKDPQSAQIIAVLDKIFKDNNVSLNGITFSEGSKDNFKYLEVKISFITSYETFKTISQEIEKELRLMDIDKVTIKNLIGQVEAIAPQSKTSKTKTTKTTQPPSPFLDFNLTILAYYLPKESMINLQLNQTPNSNF